MAQIILMTMMMSGCFGEQHPSCPDGTKVLTFFDVSSTKTMACTKRESTLQYSHGWELSYIDRGEGFISMQRVDTKLLRLICRTPEGNDSIKQEQIDRIISSTAYKANCMGKPLRPLFNKFERALSELYRAK